MKRESVVQIPLEKITPHASNRSAAGCDPVQLQELADSIAKNGVQEPAIVRKNGSDTFELVAGHRRWKACRLAGLKRLPCIVRECDDNQVLQIQLVENLQREDVHPLDESAIYLEMMALSGYNVRQIAESVGKSTAYVYMRTQLKSLVPLARAAFAENLFSMTHALEIARLEPEKQVECVEYLRANKGRHAASMAVFARWLSGARTIEPRPKRRVEYQEKKHQAKIVQLEEPFTIIIKGSPPYLLVKLLAASEKDHNRLLKLLQGIGGDVVYEEEDI